MHSVLISADSYYHVFCVVRSALFAIFVPNWIWREKHSPHYTSKPNSDPTEQLVGSTYVSPQLEANHVIPERQFAVTVGVEPPPCKNRGASNYS